MVVRMAIGMMAAERTAVTIILAVGTTGVVLTLIAMSDCPWRAALANRSALERARGAPRRAALVGPGNGLPPPPPPSLAALDAAHGRAASGSSAPD